MRIVLHAGFHKTGTTSLQVTLDAGSCSSRLSHHVPEAHTAGIELEFSANATVTGSLSSS